MKKTAVVLAICLAALSGCGRVDSVDVDSDIVPFEIATSDPDEDEETVETTTSMVTSTTAAQTSSQTSTTKQTGAVSFVKRTGIVSVSKRTSSQTQAARPAASKNTARVTAAPPSTTPANNTAPINSNTTTVDILSTVSADTNTTAAIISTTVTTVVTTQNSNDLTVITRDDLTCHVTENSIEITYKGEPVQNLQIDTSYLLNAYKEGLTDTSYLVSITDFDFDGHYDIFVPSSNDDFNTYGTYYRYIPSSETFELWNDLTNIGHSAVADSETNTITVTSQTNDIEYEKKVYQWITVDGDTVTKNLSLIGRTKQFRLDDSPENEYEIYIDHYDYSDGNENLVKREKHIYDENNQFLGVEEVPVEWLTRD